MQLFERTKRALILNSVILLLFIGGFSGVVYYFFSLHDEVAALEAKVAEVKSNEEDMATLKKNLQDVSGSKEALEALFVTSDNEADFIKSLEALASSTNVALDITALRHEAGPAKSRFEYVTVQGNSVGKLSDVYRFLNLLSRFPKALEVKQLQLEVMPSDEKKKTHEWRGSFNAKALKIK